MASMPIDTTALSGLLGPSYLGQLPRRAPGEEEDFSVSEKLKRGSGGGNTNKNQLSTFENLLPQNMTAIPSDVSQVLR